MTHRVPPPPPGVPAEMTITLPSDDIATIHGVLAADSRQILNSPYTSREQKDYGASLARIARAIDHQARQQIGWTGGRPMIHNDCTCTSGSWFWHEEGCALLPPKTECPSCGCYGYHAIGCLEPTDP